MLQKKFHRRRSLNKVCSCFIFPSCARIYYEIYQSISVSLHQILRCFRAEFVFLFVFSRLHRIGLPPPLELYRSVSSAMEDVRAGLNINRKLKELK